MDKQNDSKILKVDNVSEEYTYVRNQICDKCELSGTYKVETQRLMDNRGFYCDELDCVCTECGAKKTFVFDVSELFKGYSKLFESKNHRVI